MSEESDKGGGEKDVVENDIDNTEAESNADVAVKDIALTSERIETIRANWDKMGLLELTQLVFNDNKLDGRSAQGRAVRAYLSSCNLAYKTTKFEKSGPYRLSDQEKEMIRNNAASLDEGEMALLLFAGGDKSKRIEPLSKEYRAMYEYMAELGIKFNKNNEPPEEKEYRPPKSVERLIPRVNWYVTKNFSEENRRLFDFKALRPHEEKSLKALAGYMNIYRFIYQINQYQKKIDRELFESEFIRFTYNKPELTEEDIDNYIEMTAEIVNISQIERMLQIIDAKIESSMAGGEKMYMNFVEMAKDKRAELNQAKIRRGKLDASLNVARSKRYDEKLNRSSSILNLVEAAKLEESRREMLELAKREKLIESEEVNRLMELDDLTALMAGFNAREARL